MESAHSMPDHQINLVRQIVSGDFSKTTVKQNDQDTLTSGIVAFMPLSVDQVQKLGDESDT